MNDNSPMLARLSAFVVWALVAGAIVFWGLRLFVSPTPAPGNAVAVVDVASAGGDLSRLFGVEQAPAVDAPPPESSRFRLLGLLASRDSASGLPGVALVSVDGKPPRPYRAGARVEDRVFLREVSLRAAAFGPEQGPVSFTLEVPRLPDAATGTLNPVDPSQLQVNPPPAPVASPPPPVQQPQSAPQSPPPGGAQPDGGAGAMGGPPPDNLPPRFQRGGSGGPPGPGNRQ